MTKYIELYGGPGSGKSTTAAHLFALMKQMGMSVEYVYEWVKLYAYTPDKFPSQVIITQSQAACLKAPLGKVDYIVTDGPLALGKLYGADETHVDRLDAELGEDRLRVFIRRVKPFVQAGRVHTEAQSRLLDEQAMKELGPFDIVVDGDPMAAIKIFAKLQECRV